MTLQAEYISSEFKLGERKLEGIRAEIVALKTDRTISKDAVFAVGAGMSQRAGGNVLWVLRTSRWYILPKLLDYFTNWDKTYGSARANDL